MLSASGCSSTMRAEFQPQSPSSPLSPGPQVLATTCMIDFSWLAKQLQRFNCQFKCKMSGYTHVAQHFAVHFLRILHPSTTSRKQVMLEFFAANPWRHRVRPCLRLHRLLPLHLHFHHFHHFRLLLPLPNPGTISLPALESVDPKPTRNAQLRIALS